MSDFDSPASNPPIPHRSTKRRRLSIYDVSEASTPRYSSPDEAVDRQPRRPSKLNTRQSSDTQRRSRSRSRSRSLSSDGSADDHDRDFHRRSRSLSSSRDTPRSLSSPAPSPTKHQPLKLSYKQKFILRGHTKGISQVRFSPDGRWIASSSADGTIKIWDSSTGKHMRTLEGHLAGVSTIAWSPDSNTIASGSDDKTIRLWHRATGKPYQAPLLGHHNYVYSLAFSPKGNMLVSGSYDEAVFLWDLRARRQMRSLPAHSDPVGGVDFIRDGTLVCSCSTDGLIRVWDTATGQCLRTLVHDDNAPVTTVRFSPNGRYLLAFTLDSCIRLWDYVTGTCKKTYQGHINTKYSLGGAFGIGGSEGFIVSGSESGDILFWDVRTKEVVQTVSGHEGVVCWVDTCPGSRGIVASGGLDGTVRIWVDLNSDMVGARFRQNEVDVDMDMDMDMNGIKAEDAGYDTLGNEIIVDGEGSPERFNSGLPGPRGSPDAMDVRT